LRTMCRMQLVALNELGQAGRAASVVLAASATAQRNAALQALARRLRRPPLSLPVSLPIPGA